MSDKKSKDDESEVTMTNTDVILPKNDPVYFERRIKAEYLKLIESGMDPSTAKKMAYNRAIHGIVGKTPMFKERKNPREVAPPGIAAEIMQNFILTIRTFFMIDAGEKLEAFYVAHKNGAERVGYVLTIPLDILGIDPEQYEYWVSQISKTMIKMLKDHYDYHDVHFDFISKVIKGRDYLIVVMSHEFEPKASNPTKNSIHLEFREKLRELLKKSFMVGSSDIKLASPLSLSEKGKNYIVFEARVKNNLIDIFSKTELTSILDDIRTKVIEILTDEYGYSNILIKYKVEDEYLRIFVLYNISDVKSNPRKYSNLTKTEKSLIGKKIRKLVNEGMSQKQAVATAINMAIHKKLGPRGGYKRRSK